MHFLVLSLVASVNPMQLRAGRDFSWLVVRGLIGGILALLYLNILKPEFTGPFHGYGVVVALMLAVNLCLSWVQGNADRRSSDSAYLLPLVCLVIWAVLFMGVGVVTADRFHAKGTVDRLMAQNEFGVTSQFISDGREIDLGNYSTAENGVRSVFAPTAFKKTTEAANLLSNASISGASESLRTLTFNDEGRMVWYFPVDVKVMGSHQKVADSGGFPELFTVDAQKKDPTASVVMVANPYVYTDEGGFKYRVRRRIWDLGFRDFHYDGYVIETTPNQEVRYIIPLLKPSYGFSGLYQVAKLLEFDPRTGNVLQDVKPEEASAKLPYVEVIVPRKVFAKRFNTYLLLRNGACNGYGCAGWNFLTGKVNRKGLAQLTSFNYEGSDDQDDRKLDSYKDDLWLVGTKERPFYVSSTTSLLSDTSRLGTVFMDARTGSFTFISQPANSTAKSPFYGGSIESEMQVAMSERVKDRLTQDATYPILYPLTDDGLVVWISSEIGETSLNISGYVAASPISPKFGRGDTVRDAIRALKGELARGDGQELQSGSTVIVSFQVATVGGFQLNGNTVFVLTDSNGRVFRADVSYIESDAQRAELSLTKVGDSVDVVGIDGEGSSLDINGFDNKGLTIFRGPLN